MATPPFTADSAKVKVKKAQALWNTMDPETIAKAYTEDSIWRNRDVFLTGHAGIVKFLTKKWQREKNYRLRKELFAFTDNKIAVQFWYEYTHEGQWYRCYGLEDWTFAEDGRMRKRQMSGNEIVIKAEERWFANASTEEALDVVEISEKHW